MARYNITMNLTDFGMGDISHMSELDQKRAFLEYLTADLTDPNGIDNYAHSVDIAITKVLEPSDLEPSVKPCDHEFKLFNTRYGVGEWCIHCKKTKEEAAE